MSHLTRQELLVWRDYPTEDARPRVVGHLAACDACAGLYAEIVRTAPAAAEPARFDAAAFVPRGLEAARRGRRSSGARAWWVAGLAAAAGLALTVLVWPPGPEPESTVRGARAFQALLPSGPVARVDAFTWDAPEGAESFRIEIADESGALVHEMRVTGRRAVLPAEAAARLRPGVRYTWLISRLDARGDTIESAPAVGFVIGR